MSTTTLINYHPATLSWKFLRHPLLMPYNRWAFFVAAINGALYYLFSVNAQDMALANFAIAILIRQQYVINFLFFLATSAPLSWPLHIRWALGKVYHFGGIHVGAFFSGSVWYAFLTYQTLSNPSSSLFPLRALMIFHLLVLITMMISALPYLRAKYHNQFEVIARFGTWLSLGIFWIQILSQNPSVTDIVLLSLVSFSVALPWLRLKKVPVEIFKPSNHAVLADFNYGVTPFAGSSTELSLHPLWEWHSFANVPIPDRTGFKLTISRAGDWTGKFIDDIPTHVWVKGIPTAGVGNIEKLFKKVVWVATGSGIGPCLPHLLANKVPSTLVWSTRDPQKTYGQDLVSSILKVQPKALIWDTDQKGKPDLVELAYRTWKESGAEAVICIANKKVTWNLVYELEARGIPSFGAIWDS